MQVVCGESFVIWLGLDGSVWGQRMLRDCSSAHVILQSDIPINLGVKSIHKISCGVDFVVCCDQIGNLWSFGNNNVGQLGTGDVESRNTFTKLETSFFTIDISCSSASTLCIDKENIVWGFGECGNGELCLKIENAMHINTPVKIDNLVGYQIEKISSGHGHVIFRITSGDLFAFGSNQLGQCGLEDRGCFFEPVQLNFGVSHGNIKDFECGWIHTVFLMENGTVYTCGWNDWGQLGHSSSKLEVVKSLPPIQRIFAGPSMTLLIDSKNNIWGFGASNLFNSSIPRKIKLPKSCKFNTNTANFVLGHHVSILISNINDEIWCIIGVEKAHENKGLKKLNGELWDNLVKVRAIQKSARK